MLKHHTRRKNTDTQNVTCQDAIIFPIKFLPVSTQHPPMGDNEDLYYNTLSWVGIFIVQPLWDCSAEQITFLYLFLEVEPFVDLEL